MANEIVTRIRQDNPGTLYFIKGLSETRNNKAVNRILATEEKRGNIIRIGRGIYLKPEISRFGIVYPSVFKIAEEIAKRDCAQILPSGQSAENILGLSTQVPINYTFLTSGSAREIHLDDARIIFKRGVPRNFAFENKMMAILNQALKSIGKDNISEDNLSAIRNLVRKEADKESIHRDLRLVPEWIKDIVLPTLKLHTK